MSEVVGVEGGTMFEIVTPWMVAAPRPSTLDNSQIIDQMKFLGRIYFF